MSIAAQNLSPKINFEKIHSIIIGPIKNFFLICCCYRTLWAKCGPGCGRLVENSYPMNLNPSRSVFHMSSINQSTRSAGSSTKTCLCNSIFFLRTSILSVTTCSEFAPIFFFILSVHYSKNGVAPDTHQDQGSI